MTPSEEAVIKYLEGLLEGERTIAIKKLDLINILLTSAPYGIVDWVNSQN